jgi:PTS system cellobiose-specific IIC component
MADFSNVQMSLQRGAGAIQNNKYISAITNGLMSAMPITIVGALGSLVNSFPVQGYQDFLVNTGLKAITVIPSEITTNLLAIYVVYLIAAKFAESYDIDGTPAGILALMSFLIVTPFNYSEANTLASLPATWMGAPGLFTAFLVALLSAKVYTIFKIKGWVIKMPDGVPPTVSKSFSGLVPGLVLAVIAMVIRYVMTLTAYADIHSFIFSVVAAPLTKLGGSFTALLVAMFAAQILWLVGVHGAMVVYSVFMPIWTPLGTENLAAYNAGLEIPNIVSGSMFGMVVFMGSGATLGLALAMLRAKSEQYRVLGKLSLIPNICGINEPIIFGMPIIMNFTLAIPFILVPLIIAVTSYLGMLTGILPYLPGIAVPLGVPVIINGLMAGGWRWAVYQALMIGVSYFVYLPFFKVMDKAAYKQEVEAQQQTEATELDNALV